MKVGILALQGAISPHAKMLQTIGVTPIRVTSPELLHQCDKLIIPGGESTTMLKLIDRTELWEPLLLFGRKKPIWGTCAGAILLAKEVRNPTQRSLGLIDIIAERNAYGSQLDSFKGEIEFSSDRKKLEVDFIRAPKLTPISSEVTTLATLNTQPVLLQQRSILVSSFHVELGENPLLHQYFIDL